MSNVVIKVENVSKLYRLGQVGRRTIKHDLNRWLHKMRGKEDPYLIIGEENDRTKKQPVEYVWALRNISFDLQQGEVLGIIGRNGAGKSTLLKILSKVTAPTTGVVKSKGRIASLLEVGTGFHPDLTGRDNIFLNGAILGMKKKEIEQKFDEIVDFSGVERYIDTPVKRYSSGMYVRLAFSVAAHLEPEILIVDEVLAVGDIEFQKKCMGKMRDVSDRHGRTILFVSHNMGAIQNLCNKAMLLRNGNISNYGEVDEVVGAYAESVVNLMNSNSIHKQISEGAVIKNYKFLASGKEIFTGSHVLMGQSLEIEIEIAITDEIKDLSIAIDIFSINGELFSHMINEDGKFTFPETSPGGYRKIRIQTSAMAFVPGYYTVDLWLGNYHTKGYYSVKNALQFYLEQSDFVGRTYSLPKNVKIYLESSWQLVQ